MIGWMNEWINERMVGWMNMDAWMDIRMDDVGWDGILNWD